MTQTIAWPVLVDMELVRKCEKKIVAALTKEFPWMEAVLQGSSLTGLTDENKELVRVRLIELVNADPTCNDMPESIKHTHHTILMQSVLDEVFGFGPLGPVLRDPTVWDIWVNGPDAVYVEREKRFEKAGVNFESEEHLLLTIRKVLQPLGYELSKTNPAVQAMLPNGSLVIAALPPKGSTQKGPILILRAALK